MDPQIDSTKEEKLKSLLDKLEIECGIFERIVYKNKNQHRRSSYFQYLLKVRRDLRLLKSANLKELVNSCFLVITGDRPKQKVQLLERLKRRKYDDGKHNFMERLLGAARLLSQIVEPMLRAATEVSTLVARSFFMGFSLTVLALLARLRVLVQQILLDIVPLFNTVSSLSQKKQSTKITHQGIEVFREFFPKKDDYVTIECVWNTDKFELVERTNKCDIEMQEGDNDGEVSVRGNAVKYKILESFLGDDDEPAAEKADAEISPDMKDSMTDLVTDHGDEDMKQVEDFTENIGLKNVAEACSDTKKVAFVSVKMPAPSTANSFDRPLKAVTSTMNSFVSVKMPAPSTEDPTALPPKEIRSNGSDKADAFYSLLTRGNLNDSLFG